MNARRRQLLDIAADLFAEHGYARVTVDEIGAAAGISGPAIYHHFDGKEALLGEMLIGISEYLLEGGRRVVGERDESDTVERLIAFHVEFAVDRRSLITVHFRDLLYARPDDVARVRAVQNEYVDLWTNALRDRVDVDTDRALAAVHATFGLINSTPHSGRLPRTDMVTLLTAMASDALLATIRS